MFYFRYYTYLCMQNNARQTSCQKCQTSLEGKKLNEQQAQEFSKTHFYTTTPYQPSQWLDYFAHPGQPQYVDKNVMYLGKIRGYIKAEYKKIVMKNLLLELIHTT